MGNYIVITITAHKRVPLLTKLQINRILKLAESTDGDMTIDKEVVGNKGIIKYLRVSGSHGAFKNLWYKRRELLKNKTQGYLIIYEDKDAPAYDWEKI